MQSLEAPTRVLLELETALQRVDQPSGLSGMRFDQSHESFERSSNQQQLIYEWLVEFVSRHYSEWNPLRILSVGCGSGILDNPLIKRIAHVAAHVEYTGVDPNDVACRRFQEEFSGLGLSNVQLDLRQQEIETLESAQQFDLIHIVHSLYYFDDPAGTLDALLKLRAPGGNLVIIQAPEAELNQMAKCFWKHHVENGIWFSDRLADHLADGGFDFSRQRIHGEVDVTRCFASDCSRGEMILDFITQSESRHFNDDILSLCRGYLRSVSHSKDDSLFVSHPADAFVIA